MKYAAMMVKGQITRPVEMRRALRLKPAKNLNITLQGENICISKPADIAEARKQAAQAAREKTAAQSGDGRTAHVTEKYGR
jgi:bifunctional DNA-binding transcriptional regulator/antitoxin component of YhaV-PrlF toxin-antitoxin module